MVLGLCIVGTLCFLVAFLTNVRRRQRSRRVERGIAEYLNQIAAKRGEQAGVIVNS